MRTAEQVLIELARSKNWIYDSRLRQYLFATGKSEPWKEYQTALEELQKLMAIPSPVPPMDVVCSHPEAGIFLGCPLSAAEEKVESFEFPADCYNIEIPCEFLQSEVSKPSPAAVLTGTEPKSIPEVVEDKTAEELIEDGRAAIDQTAVKTIEESEAETIPAPETQVEAPPEEDQLASAEAYEEDRELSETPVVEGKQVDEPEPEEHVQVPDHPVPVVKPELEELPQPPYESPEEPLPKVG